jgi:hypothetical protein
VHRADKTLSENTKILLKEYLRNKIAQNARNPHEMGVVEYYVAKKAYHSGTSYTLLLSSNKACTSRREPMRTLPLVAGYERWRAAGGKAGPPAWSGGRPRREKPARIVLVATPEERRQAAQRALAALDERRQTMPEWSPFMHKIFAEHAAAMARKPHLVVSHEEERADDQAPPARASAAAQLTLVHDADALARDIANIGKLAIARIKETLSKPFNPADPNYQALLRFCSGVYNSTMNTMLRADENLLRARAVDRLPELLERIALEEKKRNARTLDLDDPA